MGRVGDDRDTGLDVCPDIQGGQGGPAGVSPTWQNDPQTVTSRVPGSMSDGTLNEPVISPAELIEQTAPTSSLLRAVALPSGTTSTTQSWPSEDSGPVPVTVTLLPGSAVSGCNEILDTTAFSTTSREAATGGPGTSMSRQLATQTLTVTVVGLRPAGTVKTPEIIPNSPTEQEPAILSLFRVSPLSGVTARRQSEPGRASESCPEIETTSPGCAGSGRREIVAGAMARAVEVAGVMATNRSRARSIAPPAIRRSCT